MKFTTVIQRIEEQGKTDKRVHEKLLGATMSMASGDVQLDEVDGHEYTADGDFVDDMVDELHEVFDQNLATRNIS